jgi:hypothetical protein
MPVGLLNSMKHWQERAEGARVHAEQLTDIEAKRMMLGGIVPVPVEFGEAGIEE